MNIQSFTIQYLYTLYALTTDELYDATPSICLVSLFSCIVVYIKWKAWWTEDFPEKGIDRIDFLNRDQTD